MESNKIKTTNQNNLNNEKKPKAAKIQTSEMPEKYLVHKYILFTQPLHTGRIWHKVNI